MTVCFACGTDVEMLERVGDALFCRPCLGQLLRSAGRRGDDRDDRVEDRGERADPPAEDRPNGARRADGRADGAHGARAGRATPARAPGNTLCFVCGEALVGDAFVQLGSFAICPACAPSLLNEATPDDEPDGEDDGETDDAAIAAGGAAAPGEPDADAAPVTTPGSGTEWCAGCGRAMPGPGSYRILDGRPHCPACAAARPPSRGDGAAPSCDACRRREPADALRSVRGFRLCAACLENDPELALAVALARHRRRLERQGRRLLGDGEDD